ncbi:MAG: oligosaccharide flippase family protein [Actinomycetota bacterium]
MNRSGLVARNVVTLLATQVISWALTAVVMFFLPRYVTDYQLGRMTLADSFVAIGAIFVQMGSSTVIVMGVAQGKHQPVDYIVAAIGMRLTLAAVALVACVGIAAGLGFPRQTQLFVAIGCVAMTLSSAADAVSSVLRGQENIPRQSLADLCARGVGAALMLACLLGRSPLWMLVSVSVVAALTTLAVNLSAFRKASWPRPSRKHVELARELVLAGIPFLSTTLFLTLYGQCGPIILDHVSGESAVGWLGLVRKLSGTAMFIPTLVTSAILPTLIRLRKEDPAAFPGAVHRMTNLMLLCVAPIAIVLICMPGQLLALAQYPESYSRALPPIFVATGTCLVIWFVTQALGTALVANRQQVQLSKGALGAALLIVPACTAATWLAHRHLGNGALGTVLADNFTEGCMLAYYISILPRSLFPRETIAYALRVALAAALMGAVIYLSSHQFGLLALAPGFLAYVLGCWSLKCIGSQDLALFRSILGRRLQAAG